MPVQAIRRGVHYPNLLTSTMPPCVFGFDNSYARELPGFYHACQPQPVLSPALVYFNAELADELRLGLDAQDGTVLADLFSGNALPVGAQPIAQAYAGHQFGHFAPQLGDGRAVLIGEVIDCHGRRRDIAFKGSGRTPYSRNGDGKAAVGPMLREVLIGEAMQALRIPTTRGLAVVATGEFVRREQPLPGAVLTRVAASHLRVGTFQYFATQGTPDQLRQLADYAIARHDRPLREAENPYLAFLGAVADRQAALLAQWMEVGFIHGVMNTDNTSISGETIDYGPCAFMDVYDPRTVFSSIDIGGRYAYGAQPHVVRWNLARLAEALLPLVAVDEDQAVARATEVIDAFPEQYRGYWLDGMRQKLGLTAQCDGIGGDDAVLVEDWLDLLQAQNVDWTLAWRRLADVAEGHESPLRALFSGQPELTQWLWRWRARCHAEDLRAVGGGIARAAKMRQINPWVIPRNHRVEEALEAASSEGDLAPFKALLAVLRRPFDEAPALARYAEPAPADFTAVYRTFCGT